MTNRGATGRNAITQIDREVQVHSEVIVAKKAIGGVDMSQTKGVLEKIIRRIDRPALLVIDDSFEPAALPTWRAILENARPALERAIRSTGRIDSEFFGRRSMIGTGWMVAPRVAVTNRHVALEFARVAADSTFPFRSDPLGRQARVSINFKAGGGDGEGREFCVQKVLHIEQDDGVSPDFALLLLDDRNEEGASLPPPLPLDTSPVEQDALVASIGFPARDSEETDIAAMHAYFNDVYEVKRLSPGKVLTAQGPAWSFAYDATTLGGSSGAVVVDLVGGAVLGLHFSGVSKQANFAVRASVVATLLSTQTFERMPTASATHATTAGREENVSNSTRRASFFDGRGGYATDFLGTYVPMPMPVSERMNEASTLLGGSEVELRYMHFSVVQNRFRKFPWITAVNIDGTQMRRPPRTNNWFRDGRLAADEQVGNEVYANSGFSRGHLVRRLDPCWGTTDEEVKLGNDDTFHFTNACPQEQNKFNNNLWGNLEDYIIDNADARDLRVSVYTGPIFTDEDPTVCDVPIPLSFWKVVAWREGDQLKAVGFVLSQAPFVDVEFAGGPYQTSERSLASIGQDAGVDFGMALLSADVHKSEESIRRPMRDVVELDRHITRRP